MYISLTNTIGAIRTAIGIVRKNLQLWLDFNKSEVIGSEEVVNGDFSDGITGWVESGVDTTFNPLLFTNNSNNGRIYQSFDTEIGATYNLLIDKLGGSWTVYASTSTSTGGSIGSFAGTESGGFTFTATTTTTYLLVYLIGASGTTGIINNASIKQVTQFVKDKSPNTNNAKLFTGKALSFDGVNDYVDIDGFTMSGNQMTFALFVKSTQSDDYTYLLDFNDNYGSNNNRFIFAWNGAVVGKLSYFDNGTFYDLGDAPNDDDYHRLVFTINGSTLKMYVDNVLQSTKTTSRDISIGNSLKARLFQSYIGGFSGNASDIQIYNKAWDSDDVAFDYNNPNHLAIDNPDTDLVVTDLKGYWAMSEGDGLVAYDSSGEGNNGTINGATYVPAQDTIPQLGLMDWAKGSNLEPTSNSGTYGNSPASEILTQSPLQSNTAIIPVPDSTSDRYQYDFVGGVYSSGKVLTYSWYSKQITTPLAIYVGNIDFKIFENCTIVTAAQEIESDINGWDRFSMSFSIDDGSLASIMRGYFGTLIGAGNQSVAYWGHQVEESSSAGNFILTDGAAAIDVTTIQNPTNKGYDILGNALRLREHAFNLDGSGYGDIPHDSSLDGDANGDFYIQDWIKPNTLASNDRIITKGGTGNGEWMVSIGGGLGIRVYAKDVNGNDKDTADAFGASTLDSWQMITVVINRSDNEINYYLNDGDIQTYNAGSTWTGLINNSKSVTIGVNQNIAGFFDGLQDEILIYKGKPTAKQVKQNYKAGINKHKATSSFSNDFSSDYGI